MEVLLSCMSSSPMEIVIRTNIESDITLVNQSSNDCTSIAYTEKGYRIRLINSSDRGLSKSRNMAIKNATADICLICDDDEILYNNYANLIESAFEENPYSDLIAFALDYSDKKYPRKRINIDYLNALKISSVQIAFRRNSILKNNIFFDERLGAGTGNGAGEEQKFLYDCLKAGLNIIFLPIYIGKVIDNSPSSWFHGYTQEYFFNRGWVHKILFGLFFACVYNIYFSITKYKLYKSNVSYFTSITSMFKGTFSKK
ncbi:glycosyltransferase family 2 protein [Bacteroides fluxus]|uniref:glycosyltransferase family 2 protein n=1 Tax=Bacteroides fluxus TaxID=626930 RepID=UPI0030B81042